MDTYVIAVWVLLLGLALSTWFKLTRQRNLPAQPADPARLNEDDRD